MLVADVDYNVVIICYGYIPRYYYDATVIILAYKVSAYYSLK